MPSPLGIWSRIPRITIFGFLIYVVISVNLTYAAPPLESCCSGGGNDAVVTAPCGTFINPTPQQVGLRQAQGTNNNCGNVTCDCGDPSKMICIPAATGTMTIPDGSSISIPMPAPVKVIVLSLCQPNIPANFPQVVWLPSGYRDNETNRKKYCSNYNGGAQYHWVFPKGNNWGTIQTHFTINCCSAPLITLNSPADNSYFEIGQNVEFIWNTIFSCTGGSTHTFGFYSDAALDNPISAVSSMSVIQGDNEYTKTETFSATQCGSFYWGVRARTPPDPAVEAGRRIRIGSSPPSITSMVFPAFCPTDNTITADLSGVVPGDKYSIEITPPSGPVITQNDVAPSGNSVVFSVLNGMTLAEGSYSIKVFASNSYGCYSSQEITNSFFSSFTVGRSAVSNLTLDTTEGAEFRITAEIDVPGTTEVTFQKASGCDDSCNCTSGYADIPGSTDIDCPTVPTTNVCQSNPFSIDVAGSYCFKAVVDPVPDYCSTSIIPSAKDISIINVHLLIDEDNTIACTDTTGTDGTLESGVPITLMPDINDTSKSFEVLTVAGVAKFGVNLESLTGRSSVVYTICSGCMPDDECRTLATDCAGILGKTSFSSGDVGSVQYSPTLNWEDPETFDIYLRAGSIPNPSNWFTTSYGDIFSDGLAIASCNETTTGDAKFDGGMVERPGGTPYPAKPGSLAGRPYDGGFVFTWSDTDPVVAESEFFYITEPDPEGRYAFNLDKDVVVGSTYSAFKDQQFATLLLEEFEPAFVNDVLPANLNLTDGYIYETDDLNDFFEVPQLYVANHADTAIIYDTGAQDLYIGSQDPTADLKKEGWYNSTLAENPTVLLITNNNVKITDRVGYGCWVDGVSGEYFCGDGGNDYSPDGFDPNIKLTIVTAGNVEILNYEGLTGGGNTALYPDDLDRVSVLKIRGSLITGGSDGVSMGRSLGELSNRYPSEYVEYDQNLLYRVTKIDRSAGVPKTGLTEADVSFIYGY